MTPFLPASGTGYMRYQSDSSLSCQRYTDKFHYAILVADRSGAGRRPVVDLLARC